MKRQIIILIGATVLLMVAACEEQVPAVIDSLIFNDEGDWLDRDTDDPYEWVDGECCNDFTPFPLAIDDSPVQGVINPASDLDYYDIRITGANAGQLLLFPGDNDLTMRLFSTDMVEHDELVLGRGMFLNEVPAQWTTLIGLDSRYTLLIESANGTAAGDYILEWSRVIPVTILTINRPATNDRVQRGAEFNIRWEQDLIAAVTLALMKGPMVVDILKENINSLPHEIRWFVSEELEPDNDYRIIIYLTNEPTAMDISDVFEIY